MTDKPQNDALTFGFWVYLMSDCLLFAALFAAFAVLRGGTQGGPTAEDLLNLPYVFAETLALLASNFMMGMALISKEKKYILAYLALALILGLVFLQLEVHEFYTLALAGSGPSRSGFLSSFFLLVGTHGLHVALGSVWIIATMIYIGVHGVEAARSRLTMLGLFWHFLDVIWICIFSLVYLLGATL